MDVETGAVLGPGQDGELLVKGPQVMLGYLDNPQATAETVNEEGWLVTGKISIFPHFPGSFSSPAPSP